MSGRDLSRLAAMPSAATSQAWEGRRVLVTGHTGFKGSWLSLWLARMGASIVGFSDEALDPPALFSAAAVGELVDDRRGDVRDLELLSKTVVQARPEVIFHLAAQPFVRRSFEDPVTTYETNVMGTVNLLEAVRHTDGVQAVLVVTSDKCYDNTGQGRPFVEDDPMGGHDPYSNSKGAAELVTDAFRRSYFAESGVSVASARAGNVIGGGDWGEDRLIPDIMRGVLDGETIRIRRPDAVRPWQHVLNPVAGYLDLAAALLDPAGDFASGWNFGPDPADTKPVGEIVETLEQRWPGGFAWEMDEAPHPHEAAFLSLDSSKARRQLGWEPAWGTEQAIDAIVEWFEGYRAGADIRALSEAQVAAYEAASS